jgi:hypothetical protein
MTLPGFESETGAAPGDTGRFGLSGRWSTVTMEPSDVELIKRGWVWLALGGGVILALVVIVALWPDSEPRVVTENTIPVAAPADLAAAIAPGSLAVKISQVIDSWNEVDLPPRISRGFILHPEVGQFDSFTYRFNDSSLLAGAYDPDTEYVYAFMASSWLSDEAAPHLGLHLCHLTQPYSQECIDTFHQVGLGGQPLANFADLEAPYETQWQIGEHTWRLVIDQNVQTIRVLGAGAG